MLASLPLPVSDLTAPTVAFLENGLKGWAVDSLSCMRGS